MSVDATILYARSNALELTFRSPISADFFAGTDGENPRPDFPDDSSSSLLKTPFRYSGTMSGVSQSGAKRQVTLVGRGTAEIFLTGSQTPGRADWFSTVYRFNALSATPEPPAWLLMATALGLVAFRYRKREALGQPPRSY